VKNNLARNADAMQIRRVLTDRPSLWVFFGYTTFAAGAVGWFLISTAGVVATVGILATHLIVCLRYFLAHHPRLSSNPFKGDDLLKPAGAGGRMVTEAKAPATSQKGTSFHANTN
tara:strand:+ start:139 stop:483 length:345 start_codon:yes stop_codon:yes gene_type:complete